MASVWVVGEDLLTGRHDAASCGEPNAALVCGGYNGIYLSLSESYNGTAWSVEGQLITGRSKHESTGTLSDAKCLGGSEDGTDEGIVGGEEYNGTAWSTFSAWGSSKGGGAAGVTDALVFGGNFGEGDPASVNTYYYDGTSWSYKADMNNGHAETSGTGLGTNALASGSDDVVGESWDGTTWSVTPAMNIPRNSTALHGMPTSATVFGGRMSSLVETATTEDFDGTVWSLSLDLNSAVRRHTGSGVGGDGAISCGGYNAISATEIKEVIEVRDTPGKHRAEVGLTIPLEEGSPWIDNLAAIFEAWYEECGIVEEEEVVGYEISPRKRPSYVIVGDSATGGLYALDMNVYTDGGFPIRRTRRTQIINKNRVNVIHNRVEIEFEAGVGLNKDSESDGYDPQATLKWSDDGGNTWSAGRTVSIGQFQQYGTRAVWRRLGKSRNRIYELTMADPVKTVLIGTFAQIKACKF